MPPHSGPKRRSEQTAAKEPSSSSSSDSDGELDSDYDEATANMLRPLSDEQVTDFGALAWAPWGTRHYPGMVVSGKRCHLRPARSGWRWLLWLAEGKVSEVSLTALLPLCSPAGLSRLPGKGRMTPARGSLLHRGLTRLASELFARGVIGHPVTVDQLAEVVGKLDAEKETIVNCGGCDGSISEWAEECLAAIHERHRRSCTVRKSATGPAAADAAAVAAAVAAAAAAAKSGGFDDDDDDDDVDEATRRRRIAAAASYVATPYPNTEEPALVDEGDEEAEVPGSRRITDRLMRVYRRCPSRLCLACGEPAIPPDAVDDAVAQPHPTFSGRLCQPCGQRVPSGVLGDPRLCAVCARPSRQSVACCGCRRFYCQACLTLLVGPSAWALAALANVLALRQPTAPAPVDTDGDADASAAAPADASAAPVSAPAVTAVRRGWLCCLCDPAVPPFGLLQPGSWRPPPGLRRPLRVLSLFDTDGIGPELLHSAGLAVDVYLVASGPAPAPERFRRTRLHGNGHVVSLGEAERLDEARLASAVLPIDLLLAPCCPPAAGLQFFEFHRCMAMVRRQSGPARRFYWLYRAAGDAATTADTVEVAKARVSRFLESPPAPAWPAGFGRSCVWADLPPASGADYKGGDAQPLDAVKDDFRRLSGLLGSLRAVFAANMD